MAKLYDTLKGEGIALSETRSIDSAMNRCVNCEYFFSSVIETPICVYKLVLLDTPIEHALTGGTFLDRSIRTRGEITWICQPENDHFQDDRGLLTLPDVMTR